MSGSTDLFEAETSPDDEAPDWPRLRGWLRARPGLLAADAALLDELGLQVARRDVIDFGRAALSRLEAAAEREADARRRIESIARANFAAQSQTHAAVLDLLEARNHADLARRLDAAAQARFGLSGAAIAIEKPGAAPFGWRALEAGAVSALLGLNGLSRLGPALHGPALFGAAEDEVRSVALIRMAPPVGPDRTPRAALCAFGSPEPDGFTADMGGELIAFLARTVERMAARWPVMTP